jgi:hypothetical protein
MFGAFDGLVRFADSPDGVDAHLTFADRSEEIEGRLLVLNLRRLPAWALSRARYVSIHGVYPDFEPIAMPSADELAGSAFPDERLALFTGGGRLEIDRWLRAESLADDVLDFVASLREVTDAERARIQAVRTLNSIDYDHDVSNWFTPAQVELLYERNPAWAALEARVYGDAGVVAGRA